MWLTYSLQLISSNIKHWPNWNSYNPKENIYTLFKLTYSLQLICSNSNNVQTLTRLNPLQPEGYCSHFVHTDLLPIADTFKYHSNTNQIGSPITQNILFTHCSNWLAPYHWPVQISFKCWPNWAPYNPKDIVHTLLTLTSSQLTSSDTNQTGSIPCNPKDILCPLSKHPNWNTLKYPNPHLSTGALDFLISASGLTSSNSELVALRFRLPGFISSTSSSDSPELWRLWDLPVAPVLLKEMMLLLWQESLSPRLGLGRRGSVSGLPLSASMLTTVSNLSWKPSPSFT